MALATKWRPLPRLLLASAPACGSRAAAQTASAGDGPAPAPRPLVRVYRHVERRAFASSADPASNSSTSVSGSSVSASASTSTPASAPAKSRARRLNPSTTHLKKSLMHQDLLALAPVSKDQSVVVKPVIEYPNYFSMRKSIQHHRRSVNTQIYRESEHESYRRLAAVTNPGAGPAPASAPASLPPDWRAVIATLVAATPERSPWKGAVVRIAVSQPIYEELTAGVDGCIWEIYTRTGCTLDVYAQPSIALGPAAATQPGGAYIVLSGDSNAVALALAELRALAHKTLGDAGPALRVLAPDEPLRAPLRVHDRHTTAWGEAPRTLPALQGRRCITGRLDVEIARPATWTPATLLQYIADLAHAHLSHHRTLTLYGTPRARDEARLKMMLDALADEDARGAVSLAAFKRAMYSAMQAGPAMRPYMRLFLAQLVRVGLAPDTDVFNLFLEEAAKQKDLRKFRSVLKMMLDHGCVPNLLSWMHMLRMVEHEVAKRHVVRVMHERGLLYDSRALRLVAREMVFFDAHRAMMGSLPYDSAAGSSDSPSEIPTEPPVEAPIESPTESPADSPTESPTNSPAANPPPSPAPFSVSNFTTHLSNLYGPAWMSTTSVRRIVDVFCAFTHWDAIFAFLATVPAAFKTDAVLYNTILSRARTVCQWAPVPRTLAAMHAVGLAPDEIAYTQLLRLARWLKWPNTMAVVWLYAAAADRTTFNMRATVAFDLSHPGSVMDLQYHATRPRARFVAPAFLPVEYAAALGTPRLEQRSSSSSSSGSGSPVTNRIWTAADGRAVAKRKMGAMLLEVLRWEVHDKDLRPQKSLAEALAEARVWDSKLKLTEDLARVHIPTDDKDWPMMEVPLCHKTTGELVKTLHLPVTQYLIKRGRVD